MTSPLTLGITTSGPVAAALLVGDVEHAQASTDQALSGTLPCVMNVLRAANRAIDQVELIAVCVGPGSFTGLRIGVAFAKSVAQSLDVPIVGVSAYDAAEFGATRGALARAAVVEGKRDYYYVRLEGRQGMAPAFLRGSVEEIGSALEGVEQLRLAQVPPAEQAVRVARIGRDLFAGGGDADWRRVAIDYGQRPNAEANWEARHGKVERGGARSASKPTRQ